MKIVRREILRYYDIDLEDNIDAVATDVADELELINERVHEEHAGDIETLRAEHKKCCDAMQAALDTFKQNAQPILNSIECDLEADAPGADDYDWPDPEDYEGDEDLDPLYDSTREYLEQIDSYKEFQGKEVESTYQTHIWQSARGHAKTCSALCRQQMNALLRLKNNAHLPKPDHVTYDRKCANPDCKKPFKAVQKNSTCCSTECRDALYAHERKMNRPKAAECKLKYKNPRVRQAVHLDQKGRCRLQRGLHPAVPQS